MANRFSIEAVFNGIDRISKPVSRMQNRINKFVRSSNRRIAKLGRNFKRLGKFIGKSVAIGAGVAATAIGATLFKTAEMGDEAAKTARRLGITAEALQELRFAADRQGVSSGVLASSFTALQKRVGELKSGTGSLFAFLKKTGDQAFIRQLKLAKNTEEAFELITKRAATIEDPMKRAAFASAAFSRAGVDMLKFMEAGQDGIAKLRKEAQRYGAVISNEAAGQSEAFIDSLTNLKAALGGVGKTLATKLIPFATKAMQRFADFWAMNKKVISVGIDKFLKFVSRLFKAVVPNVLRLFKALKKLFGAFLEVASSILPKFGKGTFDLSKMINLLVDSLVFLAKIATRAFEFIKVVSPFLKPFIATLLVYKGLLIAVALVTKGWATAQLILNTVMAANPITLIVLAIAALVAIVTILINNWDKVVTAFKTGVNKIWGFLMELLDNPLIAAAATVFAPFLAIPLLIVKHWESIKTFFSNLWDGIVDMAVSAFSTISGLIDSIGSPIQEAFSMVAGFAKKIGIDIGGVQQIEQVVPKVNTEGVQQIEQVVPKVDTGRDSRLEDKEKEPPTPKVVSPQERISRSFSNTVREEISRSTTENNSTLTIKDESGKAQLSRSNRGVRGPKIKLANSGAFG